jgi:hypothetical protein
MARTPKLFSSSARHPKEGLLPCLLGGYRPSTAATSNPRPECAILLARQSAYINTTDVFGLDERFLDPLTAHPFGVSFLARAIEAIGPNPRCCPRPRWRATPYCNGSGAGTAQSRSALSMPNQTLSAGHLE